MQINEIKIDDVKEYSKNAKKHNEEQVKQIAESISQFGFRQPVVIDKKNEIVIGHGRFKAAKLLNLKTIPCVIVEDLTDNQIKALRLADNKLNESPWDFDLYLEELKDIKDIDMSQFGFDTEDVDLDLNDFFEKAGSKEPKEQETEKIKCPCCGQIFEMQKEYIV